jgi:hypothetical protein
MQPGAQHSRIKVVTLGAGLLLIGALSYLVTLAGGLTGLLPPLRLKRAGYMRVLEALQQGELAASRPAVRLPPSYRGIAADDTVFYERRADGRLLVLFPTWRGRGDDLQGYLYCSSPLTSQDFYALDWGAGEVAQHVDVCGHSLLSVKKVSPGWYRATRRLD